MLADPCDLFFIISYVFTTKSGNHQSTAGWLGVCVNHQNKRLSIQYLIKIPTNQMFELMSEATVSKQGTGIKMIFHSHAKKTHFHKKGFSLSLHAFLKCRVKRSYLIL